MYNKLKYTRRRRQNNRASHRYRLKHPSHKMKYGHRFVMNEAYSRKNQVCLKCGRDR